MVIIYPKLVKNRRRRIDGPEEGNLHELSPTDLIPSLYRDRFDRLKEIAGAIPPDPSLAPSSAFEKRRDMLDSPFK